MNATWPPAWLSPPKPSEAEAELAEERAAIQAEPPASVEPIRFEPAEGVTLPEFDDWIERRGADGRIGIDRPGQPVATRWWEHTTFEALPTWT